MPLVYAVRAATDADVTRIIALWNLQRAEGKDSFWTRTNLMDRALWDESGRFAAGVYDYIVAIDVGAGAIVGFAWFQDVNADPDDETEIVGFAADTSLASADRLRVRAELEYAFVLKLQGAGQTMYRYDITDALDADEIALLRRSVVDSLRKRGRGFTPTTLADPVTRTPVIFDYFFDAARRKAELETLLGL